MRDPEILLPIQNTPYFEQMVADKFKELKAKGCVHIHGCSMLCYHDGETTHNEKIDEVLKLQKDGKGHYLGCHPFTHMDKISSLSLLLTIVSFSVIIEHLLFHIEEGYNIGNCPQCRGGVAHTDRLIINTFLEHVRYLLYVLAVIILFVFYISVLYSMFGFLIP